MKRKIVSQGNQSITLVLPIKWVREQQLKPGEEVDVEIRGSHLSVSKIGKTKSEPVKITLTKDVNNSKLLRSLLHGAYRAGADEIEVHFENLELNDRELGPVKTHKYLQDNVNELIGISIVEQTRNFCRIKDITGASEEEFDTILRRILLQTLSISEQSIKCFKENDEEALEDVPLIYNSVHKFAEYCLRLLSKHGHKDHENTSHYYSIVGSIDDLSDAYRHITKHFVKASIGPQVIKAYEDHNEFVKKLLTWFYSPTDIKLTQELFEQRDKAYKGIYLAEKQKAKNPSEGGLLEALHSMRDATTYIIRERMAMIKEF